MQNGLGIVLAGGLGGLVYLQKGKQERLEAEQEAQRAAQRAEIQGLSSQVQTYLICAGLRFRAHTCYNAILHLYNWSPMHVLMKTLQVLHSYLESCGCR